MSSPEQKKGTCLADNIGKQVVDFCQEDEVSRLYPGKKEFVSEKIDGIKQQKQKQILLGNLIVNLQKQLLLLMRYHSQIFGKCDQSVVSWLT